MTEVRFHSQIGPASHELRIGTRIEDGQALVHRDRARKTFCGKSRQLRGGFRQPLEKFRVRGRTQRMCRIANGPVAGTPAKVARQRHGVAWADAARAVLLCKETHDEPWRAVATLRS